MYSLPVRWRRWLHKHQWAGLPLHVGGLSLGQMQQLEWFPWWKNHRFCMQVCECACACVCVCVCVCSACVYVVTLVLACAQNHLQIEIYLKTSRLFPDSAFSPSFSANVSQLFFTRGTIWSGYQTATKIKSLPSLSLSCQVFLVAWIMNLAS